MAARFKQGGGCGRSLAEGDRTEHRTAPVVRHDPVRWPEFRRRYILELRQHIAALNEIRALARKGTVTLLYGAHDEAHNDAVVLWIFSAVSGSSLKREVTGR
jgi:hypothetical protein